MRHIYLIRHGQPDFPNEIPLCIGRTDLPGGNYEELITSIKSNILTMPDNTRVLSGHGPETTVGKEKKMNPFLS